MIRLTIYHGLAKYTFDGEGHIDIIGEVKESNTKGIQNIKLHINKV